MLPTALWVTTQVVEDAFEATVRQKAEEIELDRRHQEKYEWRIFKPHLWIEHEHPPPSSFIEVNSAHRYVFEARYRSRERLLVAISTRGESFA